VVVLNKSRMYALVTGDHFLQRSEYLDMCVSVCHSCGSYFY
jgi:hypothetical protein